VARTGGISGLRAHVEAPADLLAGFACTMPGNCYGSMTCGKMFCSAAFPEHQENNSVFLIFYNDLWILTKQNKNGTNNQGRIWFVCRQWFRLVDSAFRGIPLVLQG
jgi:hypothetical protein